MLPILSTFGRANLTRARLDGADLTGADIEGAKFLGAVADDSTSWPTGFDAAAAGVLVG